MAADIRGCGDPEHLDQFYRNFTGRYNQKVACGVVNHGYTYPLEPEEANHVINRWCTSIRNRFNSSYHLNTPLDLSGSFIPPDIKCARTYVPIKIPYFFAACQRSSVNGTVHYYDIEGIAKWIYQALEISLPPHTANELQRMNPRQIVEDCLTKFPSKSRFAERLNNVRCCVIECNAQFDLRDAKFSEATSKTIEAFNQHKQQIETEKAAKEREIRGLKEECEHKDERIDELEGTIGLRDRQIVQLQSEKVQVKEERDQVKQEKVVVERERDLARSQVQQSRVQIGQQAQEIDRLIQGLLPRKTFEDRISETSFVKERGWIVIKTTMTSQRDYAKLALKHIFLGRMLERPNYFVTKPTVLRGYTPDNDPELLLRKFLQTDKEAVKAEVQRTMAHPNNNYPTTFEGADYQEFLDPLMEHLISVNGISRRFLAEQQEHGVRLTIKMYPRRWDSDREGWSLCPDPKTYRQTLTAIFGQCLRHELAVKTLQIADRV